MHKRVVVGLVGLALVLVVAAAGLFTGRWQEQSAFEQAVATMPAPTLRATYTHWAGVRALHGGTSLDEGSSRAVVDRFIDDAYRADLVSTSALYGSTYAMAHRYGFSPLDATWEMFGQSRDGAVVALRLPESADFSGIERSLRTLGYDPPQGPGAGQLWAGSVDQVARIDGSLTPVMQNVVLFEDERLVLMSDNARYASSAADVVRGDKGSLTDGLGDLPGLAEQPVSAVLWASDFACEALSMATADEEDQAAADRRLAEVGGVSPLSGLVMAQQRDRRLLVGMRFEDSGQAEDNLRPRTELASGEAVGQGGTFPDRFGIDRARSTGPSLVLDLEPVGDAGLLGDLSQGPVLFATC